MLNNNRLKNIYSKIQTKLFYMIPEKWEKIYLYASIIDEQNSKEKGEMFFYYFPKGILKKNPINVYEIPSKFNIEEEAYMKLVNKLYDQIKELKKEYEDAGEKLWTNITISIEGFKFNIEYNYEDLSKSKYKNYDRHIIWKYKYLQLPLESFNKKDRNIIENYIINERFENKETKKHTESMYKKDVHNIIEYDKKYDDEYNNEEITEKNSYQNEEKTNINQILKLF